MTYLSPIERALVLSASAVLLIGAWVFGGTLSVAHPALLGSAAIPLASLLWVRRTARREFAGQSKVSSQMPNRAQVGICLAFILFLLAQALNSGRSLTYDIATLSWALSEPPVPWLPHSVVRREAIQMLVWFIPACALWLTLTHPLFGVRAKTVLLSVQVGSALLLGVVGIALNEANCDRLMGLYPMSAKANFFASFGYINHAGAFFGLNVSLALALLLRDLGETRPTPVTPRRALLALAALVCFIATAYSTSRTAIALVILNLLALGSYLIASRWRLTAPSARLNLGLIASAIAALAVFYVLWADEGRHWHNFSERATAAHLSDDVGARWFQVETAVAVFREHPIVGAGGWGYRHLLPLVMTPKQRSLLIPGRANVHCDPLQFLAEFGVIGCLLMLAMLWPILRRIARAKPLRRAHGFALACGLGSTVVHSLVDLPFRSPAILYAWLLAVVVLASWNPQKRSV